MIRSKKKYPIEQVHELLSIWKKKYWEMAYNGEIHKLQKIKEVFDDYPIKVYSQRYELFLGSTKCIKCGLEANYYRIERHETHNSWHFNLYGVRNGNEILFTKDHIIPKAHGGKNILSNYQTMCAECNLKKGSNLELGDLL